MSVVFFFYLFALSVVAPDESVEGRRLIMQLRLAGFGLSLITRSPRIGPHELIFLKLQNITLEYALTPCHHHQAFDVTLTLTPYQLHYDRDGAVR